MEPDWSTPEGLAAIKEALAATIDGWSPPVAYAVGISPRVVVTGAGVPARERPVGPTACPRSSWPSCSGTRTGRQTYELSRQQLEAAVETLRPAEACTSLDHPNLAAWRTVLADLEANPARTAYAVFVADLDDPVESEADATLRTLL